MRLLVPLCCLSLVIISEGVLQGQSVATTLTQMLKIMQNQCPNQLMQTKEDHQTTITKLAILETRVGHLDDAKVQFEKTSGDLETMKTALALVQAQLGNLKSDSSLLHQVLQNTLKIQEVKEEMQQMKDQYTKDQNVVTDVGQKADNLTDTITELKDQVVQNTLTMKEVTQEMDEMKAKYSEDKNDTEETFAGIHDAINELEESVTNVTEKWDNGESLKPTPCPSDFVASSMGCYYFSTGTKNHQDALTDCIARTAGSGDLLSMETEEETLYISQQLSNINSGGYYRTSLYRSGGVWRWHGAQSGVSVTASDTHWYSTSHPQSGSRYNCMMIYPHAPHKWYSHDCDSSSYRYICELN